MFEAAGHAREGDVAYFKALTPAELSSLIVGRDEDGRTLFHTAAANGHLELLDLLAGSGATKVAEKQDDEVGWLHGRLHDYRLLVCLHATIQYCFGGYLQAAALLICLPNPRRAGPLCIQQ